MCWIFPKTMIYDLSPIEKKLTALRKLNLDTNNISDISHLSETDGAAGVGY